MEMGIVSKIQPPDHRTTNKRMGLQYSEACISFEKKQNNVCCIICFGLCVFVVKITEE